MKGSGRCSGEGAGARGWDSISSTPGSVEMSLSCVSIHADGSAGK